MKYSLCTDNCIDCEVREENARLKSEKDGLKDLSLKHYELNKKYESERQAFRDWVAKELKNNREAIIEDLQEDYEWTEEKINISILKSVAKQLRAK